MHRELAVGTQLAGYRIMQLIGRGGTGLVYEAEHVVLGRRAAVKTLLPALVDDAEFRERLLRESRIVAALDHPTVIPIYDAGETDGVLYVAMRLVQGPDLAKLVDRRGHLDLETTAGVLEQVAGALDAAHSSGLVHRDVKPANVLLEEATGRVYLSDFGIAKHADAAGLTRTGFFLGTIDSAAPEQIQGQPVGPPADVYALGCTIYECLAGRPPYDRASTAAVLRAHISDPPPALPPDLGLPAALDDVVARALAKEGSARYPTCRALVEDFRDASGIGRRTRAWTTRQPASSAGAAPVAALPPETTPLFGRETELEGLNELLRQPDVRLVTLTGLGGTGKTRLAIAAARAASDDFDAVAFVELANVCEPEDLGVELAQALGVVVERDGSAVDSIAARVAGRRLLLVLDSFERVLPATSILADLLAAAPKLVLLLTSHVALRLHEEHRFPVPPLLLPDAAADDPAQLSSSPTVALFASRARAVTPDFEVTAENAAAVAGICIRLDGLPLAIELAAARVNMFSPQAILSRLDQRLAFLTEGARGLPDRQQTLRGAIDWTHDLLPERERVLFARLGVFAGGWSLEAAEAICGEPGTSGELLKALASLIDNSLVRQEEGVDDEPRFTMLDTIREYALERLGERGEVGEVSRRHAQRYLALAETAEPELAGPGQLVWLARLGEQEENVSAALAWAFGDGGEPDTGLRLAAALTRFWSMRGRTAPGRRWLEEALEEVDGIADTTLARARFAAGYAARCEGDLLPATEHFTRSEELARSLGDVQLEAAALAQRASVLLGRGEAASAREAAERALESTPVEADKVTASGAFSVLAELAADEGDEAASAQLAERAMMLRRELGDRSLLARSLVDDARRGLSRGEPARTAALLREGLELARTVGDVWVESLALSTLGSLAAIGGDAAEGRRQLTRAIAIARRRGDRRAIAECVHGLAAVAALDGNTHRAARLLGAARALRDATGGRPSPVERAVDGVLMPRLSGSDGGILEVEQAAGELLPIEEVVLLALGDSVAVPA